MPTKPVWGSSAKEVCAMRLMRPALVKASWNAMRRHLR